MYLYLLSQSVRSGYDTYDSCVVAAEAEEQARNIHPDGANWEDKSCNFYGEPEGRRWSGHTWCSPEQVEIKFIGTASPGTAVGVICASFNAG